MKRSCALIALLFLICYGGIAQPSRRPPNSPQDQIKSEVSFDAIQWMPTDSSNFSLYVYYRIKPKFFAFYRSRNNGSYSYNARGELIIELLDPQNIGVRHHYKVLSLSSSTSPDDNAEYLQGLVQFSVPSGTYRVLFELKDQYSTNEFINKDKTIKVGVDKDSLDTSTPLFVTSTFDSITQTRSFTLINYSNIIPFASDGGIFFNIFNATADSISVSWTLNPKIVEYGTITYTFSGDSAEFLYGYTLRENESLLCLMQTDSLQTPQMYIPLPLQKLYPGKYEFQLTISTQSKMKKILFPFDVLWLNKPHSLDDTRIALEALRYIAPDSVVNEISSLTSTQGLKKFYEFWNCYSPDTTKAFNPVMAEFYRRVDEAIKKYSSEESSDGYKSDRGKILILYGTPTKSERRFQPGSDPIEIWTYERIRKRIIFIDTERTGNYRYLREESF